MSVVSRTTRATSTGSTDAGDLTLGGPNHLLYFLHDFPLDFGILELLAALEPFVLLDDLVGRFGDVLLFRLIEELPLFGAGCSGSRRVSGNGAAGNRLLKRALDLHGLAARFRDVPPDHHAGPDDRVRVVGVIHDLLKLVVRDDGQPVHRRHAHPLAVGQAQTAPDGLLDQVREFAARSGTMV